MNIKLKIFSAVSIVWCIFIFLGIFTFIFIRFIPINYISDLSFKISILTSVILSIPLILMSFRATARDWGLSSNFMLWLMRILSPFLIISSTIAFIHPVLSCALPAAYTSFYGTLDKANLVVRTKYTSGRRGTRYHVGFKGYSQTIRVSGSEYSSLEKGDKILVTIKKSKYGFFIE